MEWGGAEVRLSPLFFGLTLERGVCEDAAASPVTPTFLKDLNQAFDQNPSDTCRIADGISHARPRVGLMCVVESCMGQKSGYA